MIAKGARALKSWMFIYAGFVAAAAFANPGGSVVHHGMAEVSPIAIETTAPALNIEALTNRSDI